MTIMLENTINPEKPINDGKFFIDSFIFLNEILKKNQIRYCLIGGMVTGVWGEIRYTKDIDFNIYSKNGLGEIATLLEKEGFSVEEKGYFQLNAKQGVDFLGDIILAKSNFEEWVIQNSVIVPMYGIDVPVCGAEDLILLKLKAMRHRDIVDIDSVLEKQILSLDFQYLENQMNDLKLKEVFEEEFGPLYKWKTKKHEHLRKQTGEV